MELAKESLDDICGPSGTQHTGDDAVSGLLLFKGQRHEDLELQRAMEEMKQLDEILLKMICREREIKRQRKEFQARLWQAFLADVTCLYLQQNKPEDHSECTSEAVNTRLFLALETLTGNNGSCGSFEADVEEPGEKQFGGSHSGTSKSKKRQKDFVNRNIEVGQSSRTHRMTWHEPPVCFSTPKDTDLFLCSLLLSWIFFFKGDLWAESSLTGQGYTPQPSDLEQLTAIDSKIHLLLPVRDVLSVRDPPTELALENLTDDVITS
uniref:Fibrous sheath-interacting protein 1 n=1 Tax=Takifugu rubripes TaxID=31033 RepID=A0A3B5K2L8_TAKRU